MGGVYRNGSRGTVRTKRNSVEEGKNEKNAMDYRQREKSTGK
jgi:hypothetical protein